MAARKRSAPGRRKRPTQAKPQQTQQEETLVESPGKPDVVDNTPIAHVHDMDRIIPDGITAKSRTVDVKDIWRKWEYHDTVDNLRRALETGDFADDPDLQMSLVLEGSIIALLTTASGASILRSLRNLTYFSEADDKMQQSLVQLKKWHAEEGVKSYLYLKQKTSWYENQMSYMIKFLRFLIVNKDNIILVSRYNFPECKLALDILFDSDATMASLTLNPRYNVLLDFLIYFQPLIDRALELSMRSNFLTHVVKEYKRVYEFNSKYEWYDFAADQMYYDCLPRSFAYLSTMNLVLDESKKGLLENTNGEAGSFIAGIERSGEWCGEILLKRNIYANDAGETGNPMINKHITADEQVLTFDLDQQKNGLVLPYIVSETVARHNILYRILRLDALDSAFLSTQFKLLSGLVDPLTQPLPNDAQVISIDLLYQMFIGLAVRDYGIEDLSSDEGFDWRFMIAFNMQKIIRQSLKRLNCSRYSDLVSVSSNSEEHWKHNLHKWIPKGLNTQDLELIYMIDIVAVYTIYSLYSHLPIQMNPFLSSLIRLWKNLSCVILLGLEIDRVEEVHETFETPLMVRATIRGATALRAVVASVLNQHVDKNKHDFKHESFNTFMSPFGRKLCQGTLLADLRTHAAAMFALGCDMKDITDLLADLQAGDRFDEDVRYMFEYEYDDYNDVDYDDPDTDLAEPEISGGPVMEKIIHRRCNCIFEDDKIAQAEDDAAINGNDGALQDSATSSSGQTKNTNEAPTTSRIKSSFEFDYSGNDWRDVPRGFNLYFSPNYHFVSNPTVEHIYKLILKATNEKLDEPEAMELLESVASCVKIEQEQMILQNAGIDKILGPEKDNDVNGKLVTPDDIYEIWCEESAFERMLYQNQALSWRLMDEMLMCSGYRRVLIWFVTHMEINHTLIHYIFELAMGMRGNASDQDAGSKQTKSIVLSQLMGDDIPTVDEKSGFSFSRQGCIQLSDIETKMLLQEFFTSAAIFLSSGDPQYRNDSTEQGETNLHNPVKEGDNVSLYSIGLIKLICYMVQSLIKTKKFDFSTSECTFELQTLLMNWIGVIPEAQELFFLLKTSMANAEPTNEDTEPGEDADTKVDPTNPLGFEIDGSEMASHANESSVPDTTVSQYNKILLNLLPSRDADATGNIAIKTLSAFLKRYSLTTEVPSMGRKILHYDDTILPLADIDKPQSMSNLMQDGSEIEFYF